MASLGHAPVLSSVSFLCCCCCCCFRGGARVSVHISLRPTHSRPANMPSAFFLSPRPSPNSSCPQLRPSCSSPIRSPAPPPPFCSLPLSLPKGCLLIAFRQDKLRALGLGDGLEWKDLWRPELKGRVSFPDEPRTLLGVVFKEAGLPFDAPEGEGEGKGSRGADWEHLQERLRVLKGQVLTTNSTFYLKSLVAGDAWVAVGWSTDLIPFARVRRHGCTHARGSGRGDMPLFVLVEPLRSFYLCLSVSLKLFLSPLSCSQARSTAVCFPLTPSSLRGLLAVDCEYQPLRAAERDGAVGGFLRAAVPQGHRPTRCVGSRARAPRGDAYPAFTLSLAC